MASEEKKEGAWVKIVLALIAGGATVLAATLPLYLSSQRADTADSESGTLRRQVESLQSTVKAKDTQIAELNDQARRSAAGSSTHPRLCRRLRLTEDRFTRLWRRTSNSS